MQAKYSDRLEIYTDGSKATNGRVAIAFHIPELGISSKGRITDKTAIYTAELTAIKKSIEWVDENAQHDALQNNRNIVIYSDSLSSIKSLGTDKSNSRPNLVMEIKNKINSITNKTITITWIPSHSNIRGNEVADTLAKTALGENNIQTEVSFEVRESYEAIDKYIDKEWQKQWTNGKSGSAYKEIEPIVSKGIKYQHKNRKKETTITRLRLGKCALNSYLHKFKIHPDGLCEACKVPETVEHFLMGCRKSGINIKVQQMCQKLKISNDLKTVLSNTQVINVIYENIKRRI